MKIKTSELTGAALDWAVTKARGDILPERPEGGKWSAWPLFNWKPSSSWLQCGPLIDKYRIDLSSPPSDTSQAGWDARVDDGHSGWMRGPTPLIAACRAIVAAKIGDEVEIPEELCEGQ